MEWEATIGEGITYGSSSPLDAVLSLAIDDGVPSRGHRTSILSPDYYFMGAGSGKHTGYRYMTVVDYSGSYNPTAYDAPKINVPKTVDSYTGYPGPVCTLSEREIDNLFLL